MGTILTETIVPISKIGEVLGEEKFENQTVRNAAALRVANEPLPGPMADAVGDNNIVVQTSKGDVQIRPVVAYDFTIFKKLNSPLYRLMLEPTDEEKAKVNWDEEEAYEMVFQFTHSCKEVRQALSKGRESYKEEALSEVADSFLLADVNKLVEAITAQIKRGFSTMVAHEVTEEGDKKKP